MKTLEAHKDSHKEVSLSVLLLGKQYGPAEEMQDL